MALIRSNLGRSFRAVRETHAPHMPVSDVRRGATLHPVPQVSAPARLSRPALFSCTGATDGVKAQRLAGLRALMADIERPDGGFVSAAASPLPLGLDAVDRCLPGSGLSPAALHEIVPAAYGDYAAAIGFGFALMARATRLRRLCGAPILVVSRPAAADFGRLYAHGFAGLGVEAGPLLVVETRNDRDALWAMEETLRSEARPALVLGLIGAGVTSAARSERAFLTQSRRLTLAAAATATPLVLSYAARDTPASAALTRWRIGAAPSGAQRLASQSKSFSTRPLWSVALERCRNGRTGHWLIEWDHDAYRFHLAQGLAHSAPSQGRAGSFRYAG